MQVLLIALAALVAGCGPARAGFIIAPIVTALGITGVAATIVTSVVGAAVAVGVSYLAQRLLRPKGQESRDVERRVSAAELDIRIDANVPRSLIVGYATTAGSLVYANTFGADGPDGNDRLIEIIALADHPCEGLEAYIVDGRQSALSGDNTGTGFEVDGYEETGPGALRLRFYDGTQTSADSLAVDNLGNHPDNPWTSGAVGHGVTYARMFARYERERIPRPPKHRFAVKGIRLYDPRLDSTVSGGSGSHRWDDLSTHEWTDNVAVIIYNIVRGIRVADLDGDLQHFFGVDADADQLPLDVWFAAMNECDSEGWKAGGEISVDTEPREAILELLKACDGQFVEIGGLYKLYIGEPAMPVLSIGDGTIRADDEAVFRPIKGLEERVNHVTAEYVEPDDTWQPKTAPSRTESEWVSEDGRRRPAHLDAPMVQDNEQIQRLMQQMLRKSRQQRVHILPLPPSCLFVEPGDAIEWTSDRNGYDEKLFQVGGVEYLPNLDVRVTVTEVDPDDYDWDAETDLQPKADGSFVPSRPAAKVVQGFAAEGFVWEGDNGTRRPAIRITWNDPDDDDLIEVHWELRRPAIPASFVAGKTDEPAAEELIIVGGLQHETAYEVRARFRSHSGWRADWSLWIPVTTPDARISLADLNDRLNAMAAQLDSTAEAAVNRAVEWIRGEVEKLTQQVGGTHALLDVQDQRIVSSVGKTVADNRAQVAFALQAVADEAEARAQAILDLLSAFGADSVAELTTVWETHVTEAEATALLVTTFLATTQHGTAEGNIRFIARSAPSGVAVRFALEGRAGEGDSFESAGIYLDVQAGVGSRVTVDADLFAVDNTDGGRPFEVFGGSVHMRDAVISGDLLVGGVIAHSGGNMKIDVEAPSITFSAS